MACAHIVSAREIYVTGMHDSRRQPVRRDKGLVSYIRFSENEFQASLRRCRGDSRFACGCRRYILSVSRAQGMVHEVPRLRRELDDSLSNRHIDLDPAGYFIINVDRTTQEIVAEHYTNTINKNGVACDPETGKPIPCTPGKPRQPSGTYRGGSAKELSVLLLEEQERPLVTMLVHANYLGREFQRAEAALICGDIYIQD
eukprot:jgi/Botrbrau1/5402/Bobra.182_1s0006.1